MHIKPFVLCVFTCTQNSANTHCCTTWWVCKSPWQKAEVDPAAWCCLRDCRLPGDKGGWGAVC